MKTQSEIAREALECMDKMQSILKFTAEIKGYSEFCYPIATDITMAFDRARFLYDTLVTIYQFNAMPDCKVAMELIERNLPNRKA